MTRTTNLAARPSLGRRSVTRIFAIVAGLFVAFLLMGSLATGAGAVSSSSSNAAYPPAPSITTKPTGSTSTPAVITSTSSGVEPATAAAASSSELASTGEPIALALLIGVAALGGGLVLLTATRRAHKH